MPATAERVQKKDERIYTRVTPEAKSFIEEAAGLCGETVSTFVLRSAVNAATQTIKDHRMIQLSARDSEAFAHAILNPPAPNETLKRAKKRYEEMTTR